jgi:hypothetical protein
MTHREGAGTEVQGMTTVRPEFATTSPEAASDELIRDYRDYLLAAAARANWHDTHRWEGPPPSVDAVRQALLDEGCESLPLVDVPSPGSGPAGRTAGVLQEDEAGSRVHNVWHLATGDKPPFDKHR